MPRALRTAAWAVVATLGAFQAIAYRHAMNPDGLSYLDVARAFASGNFTTALNPHWGPLYPALVALGFLIARPSVESVIPIAHVVNFIVFLAAFAAFDFFLHELLRDRGRDRDAIAAGLWGYAVFLYVALVLISLRPVTPDFCVAASVFGAAGLILRMRRRGPTPGTAALLGLVLAVGYFAKSVMFVFGLAFIGGLIFLPNAGRRRWQAVAVAAVVFLGLASFLVLPFSRKTGGLTFGTAGKLAYNWEVNRIPYTNWQGDGAGTRLEHPPRQVRSDPDLFEYTRHLEGTYPPWFDPAYWNAGAVTVIHPWNQLLQFHRSTEFYLALFVGSAAVVATLLALLAWGRQGRDYWAVLLPSVAALAVYFPVHLEQRYVAPFAALLWIIPVATARPTTPDHARFFARATTIGASLLLLPVVFAALSDPWERRDDPNPYPMVATALHRLGIAPGDLVANVGVKRGENFGSSFEGYWAYLAGVRIVAEIPEQRDFICRDPVLIHQVLAELTALGARAVVTRAIPETTCAAGWQPIAGTDFYVRMLR